MIRTFHHEDFAAAQLAEQKARHGHRVSVCLPARDEAATIGAIVEDLRCSLVERTGLVDEILVVDDHSTDDTAAVAHSAGARVVAVDDVLPELGAGEGKGEALWKSVAAADGDLIVWCDADITDFGPRFVVGLVGPLLARLSLPGLTTPDSKVGGARCRSPRCRRAFGTPRRSREWPRVPNVSPRRRGTP